MTRGIFFNTDRQTEYDERGDIRNVTEDEYIIQRIFVAINENVDMSPPTLEDSNIEEQRSRVAEVVSRSQFTREPISVTIRDVDYEDNQVSYTINTRRFEEVVSTQ